MLAVNGGDRRRCAPPPLVVVNVLITVDFENKTHSKGLQRFSHYCGRQTQQSNIAIFAIK